jgi:hypothetical protein
MRGRKSGSALVVIPDRIKHKAAETGYCSRADFRKQQKNLNFPSPSNKRKSETRQPASGCLWGAHGYRHMQRLYYALLPAAI